MKQALFIGGLALIGIAVWDQAINPRLPGYGVTTGGVDIASYIQIPGGDWAFAIIGLLAVLWAMFL